MIKASKLLRKKPNQERAQATFNHIIEATKLLLHEIEFDEISTNKIAKRAGVSIGTLYQYFGSKEAVLDQLIDYLAHRQFEQFKGKVIGIESDTIADFVEQYIECFYDFFYKNKRLRKTLIRNFSSNVLPKIVPLEDQIQQLIQNKLKNLIQSEDDLQIPTFIFVHTPLGLFRRSLMIDNPPDIPQLKQEIKQIMVHYLNSKLLFH